MILLNTCDILTNHKQATYCLTKLCDPFNLAMLNQCELTFFLATSLDATNQKCLMFSEKQNVVASFQCGPYDSHLHALL